MITLLLAEDEFFTRKGLLKHLNFSNIGIDHILEAENGKIALSLANEKKIDILLTDVKMPHMDGIELAKNIRNLYPDCIILFLSGYSDREYLRSALSLRTFRYIDKPVDTDELEKALSDAVHLYNRLNTSTSYNMEETRKQFTCTIIKTASAQTDYTKQLQLLNIPPSAFFDCRTILIQLLSTNAIQDSSDFSPILYEAMQQCQKFLSENNHTFLISEFKDRFILIHLLSSERLLSDYPKNYFHRLLRTLSLNLEQYPHFIAEGEMVHSLYALHTSFSSAVFHLQRNFYFGRNSISYADQINPSSYEMPIEIYQSIQQAVIDHDKNSCMECLHLLYQQYCSHPASLISNTKANYHRLLYWLFQYRCKNCKNTNYTETFLLDKITNSITLEDLHTFAVHSFSQYFDETTESISNNTAKQILLIIEKECSNPNLSIQYICDKINLSSSHASFLFKNATGETINQHIQNIRIQQAEKLLINSQLKITDIALKCGFPDSNYFTKLFRKKTGFLPSKYREIHSI